MRLRDIGDIYGVFGLIFSLSNRIQTIGDNDLEGITMKQQFLMIAVQMQEYPMSLKEMSDLIGCSYQNVKRMAQSLEKSGYLKIEQDQNDKRKLLLVSTGKIDEMGKENSDKRVAFMARLFKDIPEDELAVTLKTLLKMDHNIGGTVE